MGNEILKAVKRIYQQIILSKILTGAVLFAAIISVTLIASDSMASVRCEQVFNFAKTPSRNETLAGVRLLLERDQRLHVTPMVEKAAQREGRLTGVNLTKPADKVEAVYGDVILYKLQSGKGLRTPVGANVRTKVNFE